MPFPAPAARAASRQSSAIREILVHARQPGVISLAGGVPAPATFPLAVLADATDAALADGVVALQYGLTPGEPAYREVFAAWTGLDPAPSVEQIVVTTGSQQGIELLTRTFVDPRDTVVVADVDYLGALQVFRSHDASLHTVPIDDRGLDVERLAADLASGLRPKLVYTVPNHHNPTGVTLDPDRATELAALAERYGFFVVEDDPYRELSTPTTTPTVIGAGSPNVIRLRSVSKILAPGLRLGWMVLPAEMAELVTIAKQSLDLHTSTLSQAVAAHALADHRFPGHLVRVRGHYEQLRQNLISELRAAASDLEFTEPSGGMFLWASGAGVDTAALLPRALDAGVAYVPGDAFAALPGPSDRLRLSYATATSEELHRAVSILTELLRSPN